MSGDPFPRSAASPAGGAALRPVAAGFALVVVLHDSAADLGRLLVSLDRHLPERPHVVAVDTGSGDGGPHLAREWGAEVIGLGPGTGFGAANNAGIARVGAGVTVLLNPDVVLLDQGLLELVDLARARDALLVPRLLNSDWTVQRSAHPTPGTLRSLAPAVLHPRLLPAVVRLAADPWRSERPRRVGWAVAAALAARTSTLRRLGPFDPSTFLFYEDMDLCLRAAEMGIRTELHPEIRLLHRGAHATSAHYGSEPHEELARRRREVLLARRGPRALALDDAAQALTFATRTVARALAGRDARRPAAQLRALARVRAERADRGREPCRVTKSEPERRDLHDEGACELGVGAAEVTGPDAGHPLRRRPPAETLDWVAASVGRDAEVVSVRRLTEGRWHANHVVTVRDPGGPDRELVLRRWARPEWELEDPGFTPEREAVVLELVASAAVPTPQVISLDSTGAVCDVPTLLTDKLPGEPPGQPRDLDSFARQLAEALPMIHAVDGDAHKRIPAYERYHDLDSIAPPPWARKPQLWTRASAIAAGPAPPGRECFIHRDYHPNNTLWSQGRLTGVVDWTQGSWGPAAVDTAHMGWNLALAYGLDAARQFLEHYRSLTSDTEHDQYYWDVVTLLDVLPIDPDDLPPGWEVTRLEQYLETVLEQA